MGLGGKRHAPAFYPRESPGTHCIGGSRWVRKISPPLGFDPGTVQPVVTELPRPNRTVMTVY